MKKPLIAAAAFILSLQAQADIVAHFPMDVRSGQIVETVSGNRFGVEGNFAPENVDGAVGKALRFDGYTSHVDARLNDIIPAGSKAMTVSMWVAVPSYPIIQIDTDTQEKTVIASCLDTDSKSGFGFYIGFNGKYSFRTYVGGWPVNIDVDTPLPTYCWNNLVAVIDCSARSVKLYNNGTEVGSARANGTFGVTACPFRMGQGIASRMDGPFELMSFNGLIDDITVWNEALPMSQIQTWTAENPANLDIPASRFADDLLRPHFHGMPAAAWTNECHGMYYSAGRYHLFFQKNADGPYMARLHWGHISSENLYDWREEKIALAPGDWYDIKGCWSGCVFQDDAITGSRPGIIYTAVDYGRASIAKASPETAALDNWTKSAANPIIAGRPNGLSDDFRDPYFFRSGSDAYIIVGSSKNGVGTTTLHKYNPSSGLWSNNGDLFFTGSNAARDGVFWEMPNITPMPGGKWIFTATPLATSQGVRTLYWTGTIAANGTFVPDAASSNPRMVEMTSRDGFGLLSPTICNHDGKTIVLGIVPDKLPAATNWRLGWAHCYSLPREWTIDADNNLIQKPYSGLSGMRTSTAFSRAGFELSSPIDLTPVSGRAAEICATFEVNRSTFGFNVFKSANGAAVISYNPASGEIIADFSNLPRLINDGGAYDGIYRCSLPAKPAVGDKVKLNIFIDHSILDIFINDKWATSIRVFPTDANANGIEAFGGASTKVVDMKAWVLDPKANGGVENIIVDDSGLSEYVDVYNMQGMLIRSRVGRDNATEDLPAGLYIAGGRKIVVK